MARDPDRLAFLSNDVRVDVAILCREEPRTREELAVLLKRQPGGLTAPTTMKKRGVLKAVGRRASGGSRPGGELLAFDSSWNVELDEVLARRSPGGIRDGLDLVLVTASTTVRGCEALRDDRVRVSWGALLHGEQMGLLVCPSAEPHDDAATLRLLDAFHEAGASALRLRISTLLSERDLRDWARAIADVGPPALPSGESVED
jgi:hypothetical protein